MRSQTSLVATQIRLQQWAEDIHACQNRPADMKIETWCSQNGITKANYYYRRRKVREACLLACDDSHQSVIDKIKIKGAYIKSLKDTWLDTTSNNPYNDFLLTVMSGLSQLERDLISQRTKEDLYRKNHRIITQYR